MTTLEKTAVEMNAIRTYETYPVSVEEYRTFRDQGFLVCQRSGSPGRCR